MGALGIDLDLELLGGETVRVVDQRDQDLAVPRTQSVAAPVQVGQALQPAESEQGEHRVGALLRRPQ